MLSKQNINDESVLLVPVHWKKKLHWSLLRIQKGLITVYDSLDNQGIISKPLREFCIGLYGMQFEVMVDRGFPRQSEDSQDCGIYMLNAIRALAFNQDMGIVFGDGVCSSRIRIARELCLGRLLPL